MNYKQVTSIIDTLRKGWYDGPNNYNCQKKYFMLKSYQKSAIKEIKLYLIKNRKENPIDCIEKFIKIMDSFSCNKNQNINFMFSVYRDVATDVLDVLLTIN